MTLILNLNLNPNLTVTLTLTLTLNLTLTLTLSTLTLILNLKGYESTISLKKLKKEVIQQVGKLSGLSVGGETGAELKAEPPNPTLTPASKPNPELYLIMCDSLHFVATVAAYD